MTEAEQGLVGGEVGWCDRGGKGMYRDLCYHVCVVCSVYSAHDITFVVAYMGIQHEQVMISICLFVASSILIILNLLQS